MLYIKKWTGQTAYSWRKSRLFLTTRNSATTREVRDRVVSWTFRDAIELSVSGHSPTEGQSFGVASVIMLNLPTQLTCLRSDLSNYLFPIKNRIRNSKFYFINYFYFVIIIFMNYCYWLLFRTIFLPYCPVTEKPFEGVVIKRCVYVTVIN